MGADLADEKPAAPPSGPPQPACKNGEKEEEIPPSEQTLGVIDDNKQTSTSSNSDLDLQDDTRDEQFSAVEPPSEEVVPDAPANTITGDDEAQSEPQPPAEQVPPKYSVHSTWSKRYIVLGASLGAFISPLTGQIYLPALNEIARDFHISSSQVNLTVTTYMIFQGVTPMFVGGLADGAGRRPAYVICFVVFIAANIGLALCRNYASLLAVRCLQSAGSSSTVALCQAVVADIISSAERGQYIGITTIPIVFAPSLGPVLGGVLSEYLGWRSIFWFLAIVGAVLFLGIALFLPETCRKIVGDGSIQPHPFHRTLLQLMKDHRLNAQAKKQRRQAGDAGGPDGAGAGSGSERGSSPPLDVTSASTAPARPPLRIEIPNLLLSVRLATQKEIGLLLVYSSLLFAGFYAIATALPSNLERYGLNELTIGLCYLPTALGSIVAAFCVGPAINRNYRRHAHKAGIHVDKSRQQDLTNFPIERARLETGLPLYALAAAVMLCWGWAIERKAPLPVLCILLFFNGAGMIGFNNSANVLLVDITPGRAGAAVAANNLTRCLVGAGATAAITPLINAIGTGWAFFIIGMLYIVVSPGLYLIMHNGVKWRRELREAEERKKAKASEKKGNKPN